MPSRRAIWVLVWPGGEQVQQFPLPAGQLRFALAAAHCVQVSLVQVRAQQREQPTIALGEILTGLAPERHPARCHGAGAD
jgi:hypothetical protein